MYCDGQEVVYFGSSVALLPISAGVLAAPNLQLNNMPRLFPGSIGYIGRDNTNNSPNFNFNQPMNKTVQWMSFHSVVLTKNEILQATYALKYRQRKYARQKPTLVVAVGDSVNDECFSDIGPGANQCTGFNSPNGTTLSAPIDGVDTNIHFNANNVISYDAGFPGGATGGFVRIDRNEVVRITSCTTATSATSCTVQRGCVGGVCSGTGVTHGTGAYVQTAWLAQLRGILKTPATYVNGAISFFDDQVMSRAGVEQNYRKFEGSDQFAKYALTDSGICRIRLPDGMCSGLPALLSVHLFRLHQGGPLLMRRMPIA
jgi:hypothetical protein